MTKEPVFKMIRHLCNFPARSESRCCVVDKKKEGAGNCGDEYSALDSFKFFNTVAKSGIGCI